MAKKQKKRTTAERRAAAKEGWLKRRMAAAANVGVVDEFPENTAAIKKSAATLMMERGPWPTPRSFKEASKVMAAAVRPHAGNGHDTLKEVSNTIAAKLDLIADGDERAAEHWADIALFSKMVAGVLRD